MVGMKQEKAPEGSQSKGPFCGLCPFCGEPIAESPLDPCSVTVITRSGKGQTWNVHAKSLHEQDDVQREDRNGRMSATA